MALLATIVAGSAIATAAPATHRIVISEMTFGASPVAVKVGDVIEWVNLDVVAHTATSDKVWDVTIAPGKTARVTMKAAGAFGYYCRFHPNMRGTLTVKKK